MGIVGSIGSAIGGAVGGGASASRRYSHSGRCGEIPFATGGFTGTGGKYEQAGIVHRGEFVLRREATSPDWRENLYRLMRGYATGGCSQYTGQHGGDSRSQASGTFEQNNHVVINNDGTNGQIGPAALKAVYDMAARVPVMKFRHRCVMVACSPGGR